MGATSCRKNSPSTLHPRRSWNRHFNAVKASDRGRLTDAPRLKLGINAFQSGSPSPRQYSQLKPPTSAACENRGNGLRQLVRARVSGVQDEQSLTHTDSVLISWPSPLTSIRISAAQLIERQKANSHLPDTVAHEKTKTIPLMNTAIGSQPTRDRFPNSLLMVNCIHRRNQPKNTAMLKRGNRRCLCAIGKRVGSSVKNGADPDYLPSTLCSQALYFSNLEKAGKSLVLRSQEISPGVDCL